jgi:hypothetical protein
VNSLLLLKRASASRTSGEWNDDDFDVLTAHPAVKREEEGLGPVLPAGFIAPCLPTKTDRPACE